MFLIIRFLTDTWILFPNTVLKASHICFRSMYSNQIGVSVTSLLLKLSRLLWTLNSIESGSREQSLWIHNPFVNIENGQLIVTDLLEHSVNFS
jgi:hypothetical protein